MQSRSKRRAWFLLLAIPFASAASAKENPAVQAARESFEKVEASAGVPNREDVQACIAAQPEAEKSVSKPDRLMLEARGAYCAFLAAAIAQDSAALLESAAALNAARGNGKNDSSPLLKVAAAIAILKSSAPEASKSKAIKDLSEPLNCFNTGFARLQTCNSLVGAAYLWIGSAALARNEFPRAEQSFRHVDGSPWNEWLTGIYQQEGQHWRDAAAAYARAADAWPIRGKSLVEWLGPHPAPGEVAARLAYAQAMTGDWQAAGPNLDTAIAARPGDALYLYLRSQLRGSLPDLEAAAKAAASPAEAHYYKAILSERRHEYAGAAHELDLALTANPDPVIRADIPAWKLLTAAAAGECLSDPDATEKSAANASPLFPKEELASQLLDCRVRRAATLEQLIALDRSLRPRYLAQPGNDALREHITAAYSRLGVQAEDRKDTAAAADAYRRALEWSPRNTKAHFNLGALFIGEEKFHEAEAEYRALLAIDPADREAQFWLGESILAAAPDEPRKAEGCGLLQQSIKIQDSAKRDQFATAFSTSPCAK